MTLEVTLRTLSLLAWATVLWAFMPAAIRAVRGSDIPFDMFAMASAFACANRIVFSVTGIYAPELNWLGQLMGIAAAIWLLVVSRKVIPRD